MTIEQAKKKGIKIYKSMPKGYHCIKGATTAPLGYVWIRTGSLFSKPKTYKQALLLLPKK